MVDSQRKASFKMTYTESVKGQFTLSNGTVGHGKIRDSHIASQSNFATHKRAVSSKKLRETTNKKKSTPVVSAQPMPR